MSGVMPARDGRAPAWDTQATDHFDIYYQSPQRVHVDAVAREAERAYARISFALDHRLSAKVPLLLVREDRDMPRTEAQSLALVTASGAPARDHLFLSAETFDKRHTGALAHELTHQFVFELLPQADRDAPWVSEALPDHFSGLWQPSELAALRAAVAQGRVPALESLTAADRAWGHAVFDFIAAEYGGQGLRRYLAALRDISTRREAVRVAFSTSTGDFSTAFRTYVRLRLGD